MILPLRQACLILICLLMSLPALPEISIDGGLEYETTTTVSKKAIDRAKYLVNQMLRIQPKLKEKMASIKFKILIIGEKQVISDLPYYAHLKEHRTFDGRGFDTGTRGVGGKEACSVGEENLTCSPKQSYYQENILVHEFAHSIMANLDNEDLVRIQTAYEEAKKKKMYPLNIYMMANAEEYWAEGTQAWFNATIREDVNAGINTRTKIKKHDPMLTKILEKIYGPTEIEPYGNCSYR